VSAELTNVMMRRNSSVGTPFWMAPEVFAIKSCFFRVIAFCQMTVFTFQNQGANVAKAMDECEASSIITSNYTPC
jgi:serine/threonine protein kinase